MKTILLGGLTAPVRELVYQAFTPHRAEFRLCALSTLEELRNGLDAREGDLLILDLDGPEGDRLDWLALIAERRASLPVLALGTTPRPDLAAYEARYPDRHFPLVGYLPKPTTMDALLEAAQAELLDGAWGVIQGLSLSTLLQMLGMECKTCTLRVTSGRRQGFLYLQGGQVINARYRRLEGLPAALQLINSPSLKIEIDHRLHDFTPRIALRTEEILMQAAQAMDENGPGCLEDTPAMDEADHIPASEVGRWERTEVPTAARVSPFRRWRIPILLAATGTVAVLVWGLLPRKTSVALVTVPAGAQVTLDGAARGVTPVSLDLEGHPKGTLRLSLQGHQAYEQALQPGDRSLHIQLQPLPAAAVVPAPPPVEAAPEPVVVAKPTVAKPTVKSKPDARPKSDIFDQIRKQ